jgi:YVTN family beta-propeller protein
VEKRSRNAAFCIFNYNFCVFKEKAILIIFRIVYHYVKKILIIIICVGFGACKYDVESESAGNFPPQISSIIQANCLGGSCHSGPSDENEGLDLSSWDAMIKGGNDFNEVIPFTAVKSHLFGHVNTNSSIGPVITPTMPLARDALSSADQLAFFNWINNGAKSNDGKIPYSDVTKKIFVSNYEDHMVSIIDADTKRWVRIIATGEDSKPTALAMMPDKSALITGMAGSNGTIRKYDPASFATIGEFQSNLIPAEIAITPDGKKGYITDDSYAGNRIGVFDPIEMKLTKIITTPFLYQPYSVDIAPDGKYAYVCGVGSDDIVRIDIATDSVITCLALGDDVAIPPVSPDVRKYTPRKVLISGDSKTMYVSALNQHSIVVFNLTKDSIVKRIRVEYNPFGLALTPDGSELWAAGWGSNNVQVINTATNEVIAKIDSVNLFPHAIAITPDGLFAYVTCELSSGGAHNHGSGTEFSRVVIIDCRTKKIVGSQSVPASSLGIVIGYR